MATRVAKDRHQLTLVLGGCMYVAADATGSAIGERPLSNDLPYFTQPEAAADPTWEESDSCVGHWHY